MKYVNKTATGAIKAGAGKLKGIMVSAASGSPTITLHDGATATPAAAVKATGVLTTTGVFTDGEYVTVGLQHPRKYVMKTTLSSPPVVDEVLIGASTAAALDNLKLAVNAGSGAGTNYSTGTTVHLDVSATTNTDTEQTFEALVGGVAGNSIATTEGCANASFAAAAMTGGVDAVVLIMSTFIPVAATMYDFGMSAKDGSGGIDFTSGLYYTEGGTVDCTFFFE